MFKKLCCTGLFVIASLMIGGEAGAQNLDLTGVWHTDGGATFYVRQIGINVWWYGEHSPTNPNWTNVASGTVLGGVLRVHWIDVPKGQTRSEGTLTLRVVDANHLTVSDNPNGFWDRPWSR